MKKFLVFLLFACCSLLVGCKVEVIYEEDDVYEMYLEEYINFTGEVKIYKCDWDKHITEKIVKDEVAGLLSDKLKNLVKTTEKVEALSSESFPENIYYSCPLEIPSGTLWIKANDEIYRLNDSGTEMCVVEEEFKEGYKIELTTDTLNLVYNIFSFYPNNYYDGIYNWKTLSITKRYNKITDITALIKNISINNLKGSVTLELLSQTDQEITVNLLCYLSSDNLGDNVNKTIKLTANKTKEITISFSTYKHKQYFIDIYLKDTFYILKIIEQGFPKDFTKASVKMEAIGYSVLSYLDDESFDNVIDGMISKYTYKKGNESIVVMYFDTKTTAKAYYNSIKSSATSDFKIKHNDNCVYKGTNQAIKDFEE